MLIKVLRGLSVGFRKGTENCQSILSRVKHSELVIFNIISDTVSWEFLLHFAWKEMPIFTIEWKPYELTPEILVFIAL